MKSRLRTEKKKEIILGFYEMCKQDGLENVSIAKIGNHLKMPPSLIMHYFSNKGLLVLGLIEHILRQYQLIYKPIILKLKTEEKLDTNQLIDQLFSREWNLLFDDGVFFSCYAFIFRDKNIKKEYKELHIKLRASLKKILDKDEELFLKDTELLAEKIFIVIEGAYYYLSMMDDSKEYNKKLNIFKGQVYDLIHSEKSRMK